LKHLPRRWTWLALLVVFAFVIAACGDEAEETTTTAAPATTTTEATTTSEGETTTTAEGETTTTTEAGPVTGLSGLRVIDDLTFEVELMQADPEFPLRLAYAAYFPLPSVFFDDPDAFEEAPIGNGPFMMDGVWEHDVQIALQKNPSYIGPDPAQIDSLVFQIYATIETAYTEALAGNLDIVDSVPSAFLETFRTDFPDRWGESYTTSINTFYFPAYVEELTPDIRRALSMAIDKQLIMDNIFLGSRDAAWSVVPPVLAGARDYVCDYWTFDPEAAKALWDSIETKPEGLSVWFNAGGGHEDWVEAVVNMWSQNLGIDPGSVTFNTLEWAQYLQLLEGPSHDMEGVTGPFRLGWGQDYPSPYNFLHPIFYSTMIPPVGSNNAYYNNPEFDAALDAGAAAVAASGSLADGIPFYNQAEDILCDEVGAIPMFFGKAQYVWNEGVDNVFIDSYSDLGYMLVTSEDGSVSTAIVEPEHLIPTTSNESEGIAVLRALFAPLINFDAETGEMYNVVAESVTSADGGVTWTITLNSGWTFHNGEPVTAESFVNAWNYGADGANGQQNNSFYSTIAGYDALNPSE
jgi:oligopeptide transport system substrate-binding protein